MIAVVRPDDHMRDGLVRQLRHMVDEPFALFDAPLTVSDQDTVVRHDDQAHGRESLITGRAQLLVGVHTFCELLHARKILVGVPACVRIGGADGLRRIGLGGRLDSLIGRLVGRPAGGDDRGRRQAEGARKRGAPECDHGWSMGWADFGNRKQ